MPNLLNLQKLLPPPAPLTARLESWRCCACTHRFALDMRVRRMPGVKTLKRAGVLHLACPKCQGRALAFEGLLVS